MKPAAVNPGVPDAPLSVGVRLLTRLPWAIKTRIAARPFGWRVLSGLARRLGWGPASLGWHTAPNGPFRDVRVWAYHTNHVWVPMGTYEIGVIKCLTAAVRERAPALVWDIGADRGLTTLACAAAGAADVMAFEPAPGNLRELDAHLAANPSLAGRVTVTRAAVSEREGSTAFTVDPTDGSIGRILASPAPEGPGNRETLTVPCVTLDSMAATTAAPNVIKIDVEGAEAHVLRGGMGLLRASKPVLVIELHDERATRESLAILKELGYSWKRIEPDGTLASWADPGALHHILAVA